MRFSPACANDMTRRGQDLVYQNSSLDGEPSNITHIFSRKLPIYDYTVARMTFRKGSHKIRWRQRQRFMMMRKRGFVNVQVGGFNDTELLIDRRLPIRLIRGTSL